MLVYRSFFCRMYRCVWGAQLIKKKLPYTLAAGSWKSGNLTSLIQVSGIFTDVDVWRLNSTINVEWKQIFCLNTLFTGQFGWKATFHTRSMLISRYNIFPWSCPSTSSIQEYMEIIWSCFIISLPFLHFYTYIHPLLCEPSSIFHS